MNQVLDDIRADLEKANVQDRGWTTPDERQPKPLVDVLAEWAPAAARHGLTTLPLLDHPVHGLLPPCAQQGIDKLVPQASFFLVGHLLSTAVACFRHSEYEPKPPDQDVRILFRLAARLLEPRDVHGVSCADVRVTVCDFLDKHVFVPTPDHIPQNLIRFGFHQLVLYWWAIPQEYKRRWFDEQRRSAPGLEGDFILTAAETARHIYEIGTASRRGVVRPPALQSFTSYHSVKGGTGKSTLAVAHALKLASLRHIQGSGKVAILDLDVLNPSLIGMRVFAGKHDRFRFLESLLTSNSKPLREDMEDLFVEHHDKALPLLFGSVFGPGRDRELLVKMLHTNIEAWRIVVDNLRVLVDYLVEEKECTDIILDNSPGFLGMVLPSAIVAADRNGTFVLVSTLDAFDVGNIPLTQAAFDALFPGNEKRVLVMNRLPQDRYSQYIADPRDILVLAWTEALSRVGRLPAIDVSGRELRGAQFPPYESPEAVSLFVNIDAMFAVRGEWHIELVRYSEGLASKWHLAADAGPSTAVLSDPTAIAGDPILQDYLGFMLRTGGDK